MKVTKNQLKKIVRRVLKESANQDQYDLADPGVDLDQAQRVWPNVYYKGRNVFRDVYDNNETQSMLVSDAMDAGRCDDLQECYLGYSPSNDLFYIGFDCWKFDNYSGDEEDEQLSVFIPFTLLSNGKVYPRYAKVYRYGLVYGPDKGLKQLNDDIPDLVDIRLD